MQNPTIYKVLFATILIIGAMFRVSLFFTNPTNNSFDDHLEVINLYTIKLKPPAPSYCWECYQPPIYYALSAAIFKTATTLDASNLEAWKIVQFFNSFLSILVLLICYKLLIKFNISEVKKLLYMSFIAVLPIDLFTSAMVGNDYLLVFTVVASFYFFLRSVDGINRGGVINYQNLIFLSLLVIIGSLTKQHGLILLAFPTAILLVVILKQTMNVFKIFLPVYIFLIALSFSNELWKYDNTGKILVSNQDFYDNAINQFPGSLEKIEFISFKISSLYKNPFLSNETAASLPTEIFARTFFDYEWRFLSPNISAAISVGRIAYTIGVIWVIYFLVTLVFALWKRKGFKFELNKNSILVCTPVIVGLLYFAVPLIQTLRYPYFSSMKATFALPGMIILLILHAGFTRRIQLPNSFSFFFTILNIFFGILLISAIYIYLPLSINQLSGPLWAIPQ